ncbi:GNAT family N-acetyltransferase [Vagococcus lutrae]|uniref:GNAT family N-acetyltransferase n=1 Tax=Vagococcus lutrae TaxID=81947 RepID=UPI000F8776A9|nr:GNAT family N-acetyltransferase [Vagococcus lutrae]RST92551.1 GNAT family N-acetyltransferase [Vagococcus lutrae]
MMLKATKVLEEKELQELYEAVGWSAYTRDMPTLQRAISHSLHVVTAWQDDRLVGLIRVVGDGLTIVYIQDLLVHPDFQKQGIGTELMKAILSRYSDVRQLVLLTEEAPDVRNFYEACGFTSCDQGQSVAFGLFRS